MRPKREKKKGTARAEEGTGVKEEGGEKRPKGGDKTSGNRQEIKSAWKQSK